MNFKQIALAASALALTGMAAAFPFTEGSITFGPGTTFNGSGVGTTLVDIDTIANTIDFSDSAALINGQTGNAWATDVNGDFSSYFNTFDAATFSDFTYSPFASPTKVWEATGSVDSSETFEFFLTNINVVEETPGAINLFSMTGQGYLTNGIDQQLGYFNLTGSSSDQLTFTWASSIAVPEPGSLALIGLGIAGLAVSRRRQKANLVA